MFYKRAEWKFFAQWFPKVKFILVVASILNDCKNEKLEKRMKKIPALWKSFPQQNEKFFFLFLVDIHISTSFASSFSFMNDENI